VEDVFGPFIENADFQGMSQRMILASKNETVVEINNMILDRLARKGHKLTTMYGVDTVDEGDPFENYILYPPEFLHGLYGSGLPPYELRITKECPVMLVRNLNPAAGLSNGTRLTIESIHDHILVCKIINGDKKFVGEEVMIPRMKLESNDEFPFKLTRRQFPVKPCFAMTMNKCQGQTIEFVGLDMTKATFSHGQCYVAFSRVRGWDFIKVAVDPEKGNKVLNVVWKEVLFEDEKVSMPPPATTPRTSRVSK
jgi:ATP-dependent DNA helicase PIF1